MAKLKTSYFILMLAIIVIFLTLQVTTANGQSITLTLHKITNTSGDENSANPGEEQLFFDHGDTVRITFKATNQGSGVPVKVCLNVCRKNVQFYYYSESSNDSPLEQGETDYYSFDWVIPNDIPIGQCDIQATIRNASVDLVVYDDTAEGANTTALGDASWLMNSFKVGLPIVLVHGFGFDKTNDPDDEDFDPLKGYWKNLLSTVEDEDGNQYYEEDENENVEDDEKIYKINSDGSAELIGGGKINEDGSITMFDGRVFTTRYIFDGFIILPFNYRKEQALWNNSQYGIEGIGIFLSVFLKAKANEYKCPQFNIVAHSMGGLVTRSFMAEMGVVNPQVPQFRNSAPDFDGEIKRFITLATPHYGTPIANLSPDDFPSWVPDGIENWHEVRDYLFKELSSGSRFVWDIDEYTKNNESEIRNVEICTVVGQQNWLYDENDYVVTDLSAAWLDWVGENNVRMVNRSHGEITEIEDANDDVYRIMKSFFSSTNEWQGVPPRANSG